jgi:hypothetical protein
MGNVRVALGLLLGIWMLIDGVHAFATGSYITPPGGAYDRSLGPWAWALGLMQIDPLGTSAKLAFVLLGLIWLVHARNVAVNKVIFPAAILLGVLTLWYLPFGTIIAAVELLALFLNAGRKKATR